MKPALMQRVFNWNARRYDREYNAELTARLLSEEWLEWIEAESDVDLLDAMLDVIYVAIGGIWKLNQTDSHANEIEAANIVNDLLQVPGFMPGYSIMSYVVESEVSVLTRLLVVAMLAECQARMMGLSDEAVDKAFEVVCDSNDSKSVKKTASNVKANTDKGAYFIAPEPRLQEILNARLN